jgi:hypothetical protein
MKWGWLVAIVAVAVVAFEVGAASRPSDYTIESRIQQARSELVQKQLERDLSATPIPKPGRVCIFTGHIYPTDDGLTCGAPVSGY